MFNIWNMSHFSVPHSLPNREGGVGAFLLNEMYPPKPRFPPKKKSNFKVRADALQELSLLFGAYPPAVFQNGILNLSHLEVKKMWSRESSECISTFSV